jgi:hypothetical protein
MKPGVWLLLLLAVGATAAQAPVRVRGRVDNLAPELKGVVYTIRLNSTTDATSLEAPLKPDQSFEFDRVSAGEYVAVFGAQKPHSAFPGGAKSAAFVVASDNISGVVIDMRNNPVPELPGGGGGTKPDPITLRGVMTAPIVHIRKPAPLLFFRMDVRDEVSGNVVPWAVTLSSQLSAESLMKELKLSVGSPVTVNGRIFADGSHRLATASINGTAVPTPR